MITGQIKNHIDRIWNAFRGKQSGITNPTTMMEAVS